MYLAERSRHHLIVDKILKQVRISAELTGLGLLLAGAVILSATLTGCQKSSSNDSDTGTSIGQPGGNDANRNSTDSSLSGGTDANDSAVTFSQADVTGVWKFTISWPGGEFEACYDETGKRVSADTKELPTSLTLGAAGTVSGKYTTSGGSGATTWTGTYSYSGTLSDDKQAISGNQTYRRSGMSGTSTSEYTFSAVKIADNCNEPDTGTGVSTDTGSATGQDTGADTSPDTVADSADTTAEADTQDSETATASDTVPDTNTEIDSGTESAEEPILTLEHAAEAMARVHCETFNACNPIMLQQFLGSLDDCIVAAEQYFIREAAMPDTGWTIERFNACMAAVQAQSCTERMSLTTVTDACLPHGMRANDASCLSGSQCASGYCSAAESTQMSWGQNSLTFPVWSSASVCGTCTDTPAADAACSTETGCAPGQYCDIVQGQCFTPQGSLGACSDSAFCEYGFACFNGICRERVDAAGDACNAESGPWCAIELICITGEGADICFEKEIAQPEQNCGWLSNDLYTNCALVGECENGRCSARPVEGSACTSMDEVFYGWCVWPQKCVNGACAAPPTYAEACAE